MDIVGLAMDMSQARLQSDISTSVLKMSMESGKEAMEAVTDMMDDVKIEGLGNVIDVRA